MATSIDDLWRTFRTNGEESSSAFICSGKTIALAVPGPYLFRMVDGTIISTDSTVLESWVKAQCQQYSLSDICVRSVVCDLSIGS